MLVTSWSAVTAATPTFARETPRFAAVLPVHRFDHDIHRENFTAPAPQSAVQPLRLAFLHPRDAAAVSG